MFYFHPFLGKIPILTNIFQLGWNHQPVILVFWRVFDVKFNNPVKSWDFLL